MVFKYYRFIYQFFKNNNIILVILFSCFVFTWGFPTYWLFHSSQSFLIYFPTTCFDEFKSPKNASVVGISSITFETGEYDLESSFTEIKQKCLCTPIKLLKEI